MKTRVRIIAEIGVNHNGSIKRAKKMILKLSKLDIDYIKFQLAIPRKVYSEDAFKAEYQKRNDRSKNVIEMSKKLQLSTKEHIELEKFCKKNGKKYCCTAFDLDSLKFLIKKIKVPFIKIASGEILSYDILNYLSNVSKKKEVILSTGMANIQEIENAIRILNSKHKKKITLLHCTSVYPAKLSQINLNFINTLKKQFKLPVGYSDHSQNDSVAIGAIAKGATVIEKHVTLDKSLEGPDHKASCQIDEFKKFVKKIREFEIILGTFNKTLTTEEKKISFMARKSIVAKITLRKNDILKKNNITFKRPGTGISPMNFKKIIGKKVNRSIPFDTIIKKNDL